MDIAGERELLQIPFIDAGHRGKHIVVPPRVGACSENSDVGTCVVVQVISLHEDGVRVHVDIVRESECLEFGVIATVIALDDLSVFVPQGSTATEHGHTVFGVIVQIRGSQRVAVLVAKLDQRASELRQTLIDKVIQALAAQHGVVLDDLDVAECVDHVLVHIPQCGVTDQQGGIVLETGMPQSLSVALAIFLNLLQLVTAKKTHKTVSPLRVLGGKAERHQQKQ